MNSSCEHKVAIMQPYLFPYIGYWQLIQAVDQFVLYDNVNFIKKGFINRNQILVKHTPFLITLPLSKASQNRHINQIQIAETPYKMLKTIRYAYAKAPFFRQVIPLLESILTNPENNLARFVGHSIIEISNYLHLNTQFLFTSGISLKHSDNLKTLNAEEKIISLCKQLGANTYINPVGGKRLYHSQNFNEQNLNLAFLKPVSTPYKQFSQNFVPNLSIIDVLMFNSVEHIRQQLQRYELHPASLLTSKRSFPPNDFRLSSNV